MNQNHPTTKGLDFRAKVVMTDQAKDEVAALAKAKTVLAPEMARALQKEKKVQIAMVERAGTTLEVKTEATQMVTETLRKMEVEGRIVRFVFQVLTPKPCKKSAKVAQSLASSIWRINLNLLRRLCANLGSISCCCNTAHLFRLFATSLPSIV
ncbi:hypothetical protein [Parasedimentitalea psychrophila]|uniref:Uncharacterized protein n=1 Tax=Parasedimentitalea psychrophila TaxID=2997337 RepID=A0A9Y2KXE7_9RHOB|nr:hypothetical protein [Parasedimentitalea psychrophila]WIY24249.1 hypothetical protein QPJ95_16830 [Parasedimentitalea psychrophila]